MRHQAAHGALFGGYRQFVNMRAGFPLAAAGAEALVHDATDGAGAASALRAAPETAVDLVGRGRACRSILESGPHVAVAENIAGTNDHAELSRLTRTPIP